MTDRIAFTRSTQRPLLEEIARSGRPIRLELVAEGPAGELIGTTILRLAGGRVLEVEGAANDAKDAFLRIGLADRGRIDLQADAPPIESVADFPSFEEWYAEAEAGALALLGQIERIGGLEARLSLDAHALKDALAQGMSETGREIAELARERRVVDVLLESPIGDLSTASVLERLVARGVLYAPAPPHLTGWDQAPEPETRPPIPVAPKESSRPGRPASRPVAPAVPRAAPAGAPTERSLEPPVALAHELEGDDSLIVRAGIGPPAWLAFLLGAVIVVLAGMLVSRLWPREEVPEEPPRELPPVVADLRPKTATTSTQTAALPSTQYSLSNPPPVAGPGADARIREAERLLRAGQFKAAGVLLDELRKSLPGAVEVWVLSGMLMAELDRSKDATEYTDRALQIDPKNYRAWVLRGFIHQTKRRVRPAIDAYRRALTLEPQHPMSPELRSVTDRLEHDGLTD
jgi:Flp pilus assembly protein TadD